MFRTAPAISDTITGHCCQWRGPKHQNSTRSIWGL